MIQIDRNLCNDCGICFDVCPDYVIGLRSSARSKEIYVRYPEQCCSCGHCISACPRDAISHDNLSKSDFMPSQEVHCEPEIIKNLILSRRSIRRYTAGSVPRDIIEQLIDAGVNAGTGANLQTIDFMVIQDRELLQRLEQTSIETLWTKGLKFFKAKGFTAKIISRMFGPALSHQYRSYRGIIEHRRENGELEGMVFRNAPVVIIAHGLRKNTLCHANCAIAIRSMELLATSYGLGSCWVGFLIASAMKSPKKINGMLGLPQSREIYGALMIGYPKHRYRYQILRKKREVIWC
jgi:nitroreductase/NAD-dependent dihydropyrimidine dehydrogenase PreA subunit